MNINEITIKGRLACNPKFYPGKTDDRDRAWAQLASQALRVVPFSCWGENARLISQHCRKGEELSIVGRLHSNQNKSYMVTAHTVHIKHATRRMRKVKEALHEKGVLDNEDMLKWTKKEAYEENKQSEECVICNKPLSIHPSVGVKYCKCIEQLP